VVGFDGDRPSDALLAETSVAPVDRDRLEALLSDPPASGATVGDVEGDGRPEVAVPHERGVSNRRGARTNIWQACEDVGVSEAWVVAPVRDGWPIGDRARVASPLDLPIEQWR
jgi:hypothetical protein